MMFYLAHRYGPTPLLPGNDPAALARVLQLTVLGETAPRRCPTHWPPIGSGSPSDRPINAQ